MASTEQAGTANEKSPATTPETAVETALDAVEQEQDRIADLESRLTQKGRKERTLENELKEHKAKLAALEAEYSKAAKANKEWQDVYFSRFAPEAERARYAQQKAAEARVAGSVNANEAATWRAIAEEDDPKVRAVLTKVAKAGNFMSTKQIQALRESLDTGDEGKVEQEEKTELAKVTPVSAAGAARKSLQQQYEAAVKGGDPLEILAIRSQIAHADAKAKKDI
jgi:hypothetical protein